MWYVDYTAQKMKFPITDFFSKCDQIHIFGLFLKIKNIKNYSIISSTATIKTLAELLFEKKWTKLIPFLYILIKNDGCKFFISMCHKKANRLTHLVNFIPMRYQIGLEKCLVQKAFKTSRSHVIFHQELKVIFQEICVP